MKKIGFILLLLFFHTVCYSAEKLTILLDWFANPNHAPLFIAQEKGFFKAQGLDVELIGPADSADPPKLVAANKADLAITYEPQFIEQIDQGLPLIRIGTLIDKPLDCLVVLNKGPIQSIRDLKNKRIGYSSGDVNNLSLKVMLEKNGLTYKDVESINVHYALTQALLSGKVDAVTGMMRNFELIQMELAGQPARAFYPEQQGVPPYSELIIVANKNKLRPAALMHFLTALKQGVTYVKQHPEESWKLFAKTHHEINDELNRRAWTVTLSYFTNDPASFDKKSWLSFAQFMQKNGLITTVQPITHYAIDLTQG